jgi:hypothetical protein
MKIKKMLCCLLFTLPLATVGCSVPIDSEESAATEEQEPVEQAGEELRIREGTSCPTGRHYCDYCQCCISNELACPGD